MKKIYRIALLLTLLIFLSTFNPVELNLAFKKQDNLFKIKNIEVQNNLLIKSNEIKKRLKAIYKKNIFFIDEKDIAEPISEIDFLEKIEVKKRYPDTIIIKVFETKPTAIIYKNKVKLLIDSSSNLIAYKDTLNLDKLPSVFGENADKNFILFLNKLKKNNFPIKEINGFYYFQIGRWDIQFHNNKIIKFPQNNIDKAITKAIELLNREDFKNYNTIDLRVGGKIIVE